MTTQEVAMARGERMYGGGRMTNWKFSRKGINKELKSCLANKSFTKQEKGKKPAEGLV